MTGVPVPRSARVLRRVEKIGWTIPLAHLLFVWVLTLFDLHFFLSAVVAQPLIYVVHLGYPPLLLMVALQGPILFATSKPWVWFPPMLLLVAVAFITVFIANNKMLAQGTAQVLLVYWAMGVAAAVFVKTPRQAQPFLVILIAQFVWYGMWAGAKGVVPWHPILLNYDAFGTIMVPGAGLCYWVAVGTRSRKLRLFLFGLAAYCVLGVVASYARAAFLSLVAVIGWIWVRSPRKAAAAAGIAGAAVVVVIAASIIFEPGFFYNEIMSSFSEGAEEGTGGLRWELWMAAIDVWKERPLLGVGGGNFGAFASTHFVYGELPSFPNPSMLYGFNLHNAYMQLLSEFGLLGVVAFGWAIWDFQKRNRALKQPDAIARWAERTGGKVDLRYIALGLEVANIGNLLTGIFYASLFTNGYYTIWIANRIFWAVTRPPDAARVQARARGAPVQVRRAGSPER